MIKYFFKWSNSPLLDFYVCSKGELEEVLARMLDDGDELPSHVGVMDFDPRDEKSVIHWKPVLIGKVTF